MAPRACAHLPLSTLRKLIDQLARHRAHDTLSEVEEALGTRVDDALVLQDQLPVHLQFVWRRERRTLRDLSARAAELIQPAVCERRLELFAAAARRGETS